MTKSKNMGWVDAICIICNSSSPLIYSRYKSETHVCSVKCSRIKMYRTRHTYWQEGKKQCGKCRQHKLLEEFTINNKNNPLDGRTNNCKSCWIPIKYTPELKLRHKDYALKKTYGISLEDYDELAELQEGKCYICGDLGNVDNRRLSVDHCHITGKIAKLLCNPCNTALGLFKEDYNIMEKAVEYLKEYKTSLKQDVNL